MFGYHRSLRRPVASPFPKRWLLKSNLSNQAPENSHEKHLFSILLSRCRALFGPQFLKRLSSSSLCHCFFQRQTNTSYERLKFCKVAEEGFARLFYQRFARYFLPRVGLTSALLASAYVVKAESDDSLTDDMLASHKGDIKYIKSLIKSTLTCKSCQKRHLIDKQVDGTEYCQCKEKKTSVYGVKVDDEAWTPFLERKDILVWRQEHPELKGLYAYKMYGKFDDISADEFINVQVDLSEFRLTWDPSTAQCHVIEDYADVGEINHTYYWEINWPRFFSNRDYVCRRRCKAFKEDKSETLVLFTKSTEHSNCPKKSKAYRVENYWSVLTIKPFTTSDQPGIEFSLTGFENPGLSLPSYITTWVAIQAMPEFFNNLRKACLQRRKWVKKGVSRNVSQEPSYLETPRQFSSQRNYA